MTTPASDGSDSPLRDARQHPAFRRALLAWFRRSARDLPWRRTRDPYRIWVSEILLQQTRVETVLPYYRRFIRAFPTVSRLAAAPLDRVLKLWEGLGYYTRARHLHQAARLIVTRNGGKLPQSVEAWRSLPGVGRYTAAAIASIALGEPVATVDGNIRRVLARLFREIDPIDRSNVQARLWTLADGLVSRSSPGDFNQALMELGARVCRPRQPLCPTCPVRRWCAAHAAGVQNVLPRRTPKSPVPQVEEVAGLMRERGRILLAQRRPQGLLGGLWELPGGPVHAGESPRQALRARLEETLGIQVQSDGCVARLHHAFSHRAVRLSVLACTRIAGRPRLRGYVAARWIGPDHLSEYALTRATRKVLTRLGFER